MLMKFLIGLAVLFLLFVLSGYVQSGSYDVERSVVIAAPKAEIHAQVSNLTTWPKWSGLNPPTAEGALSSFEGEPEGVGAVWRWGGAGQIKPARLLIKTSDPAVGIGYDLSLSGGDVATTGNISYAEVEGGIRVSMSNKGQMDGFLRRRFSFLAERSIGPTLQSSLEGLKALVETPEQAAPVGNTEDEKAESSAGE